MADSPLKIFGLGAGGVQLVKDPLEMDDNELVQSQNAEPFQDRGRFGLRKRAGLQRVVPTGTVAPSSGGGPLLGGFVIDDPLGYPSPNQAEVLVYGTDAYSPDGGTTWVSYTPTASWPDANTIYDLASASYNINLSSLLSAVFFDGAYYYGGRSSGQVLVSFFNKSAYGAVPPQERIVREAVRVVGTGSTNDTYVLPGIYNDGWLIISLVGGGVQMYNPNSGEVKKLPTLGAVATGSAEFGGRLWVVAGLSLYSIQPFEESAWTTAATVADAGIAALTGLAEYSGNLYSGSRTSSTQPVRVYKFAPSGLGTAVASTSASVVQSANPSYMLGPFPTSPSDARLSVLYFGNAGIFDTLVGSNGGETMTSTSDVRIITFDGTYWHNGADTLSNNMTNTTFGGSTNRNIGPITNTAGRYIWHYSKVASGGTKVGDAVRRTKDTSWGCQLRSTVLSANFFTHPLVAT